ncbi:MAG: helix-turn-helix domain-containing protein [Lachnospiraceae bacterium]
MSDINTEIGKRIAALRKSKRITQDKLSELLDVSPKHISAVERGLSSLSTEKMIQLCTILDCNMDYLIRGKNSENDMTYFPDSMIEIFRSNDQNEIDLLNQYLQMYNKLRNREKSEIEKSKKEKSEIEKCR